MNKYRVRQAGIIPENKLRFFKVGIVGCGAVGSHVANSLARMGVANFVLIDSDIVSEENISCQGFYPSDINKFKSMVVSDDIISINYSANVNHYVSYLEQAHADVLKDCDVIISAVDNMQTRKDIMSMCVEYDIGGVIIDPRMGAEKIAMCVVDIDYYATGGADWYNYMLFSDDKAVDEPCTAKATIYTAQLISGLVCKAVKDVITQYEHRTRFISWDLSSNKIVDYTREED